MSLFNFNKNNAVEEIKVDSTTAKDVYTKSEIMRKLGWIESDDPESGVLAAISNGGETGTINTVRAAISAFVDIIFDDEIDCVGAQHKVANEIAFAAIRNLMMENKQLRSERDR